MALIAIDFDSTLVFGKEPLPGAKKAMSLLKEAGHKILIHSCNRKAWIEKVLRDNDIWFDDVFDDKNGKPVCDLYVDDRGVWFNGDWESTLKEIQERLHE